MPDTAELAPTDPAEPPPDPADKPRPAHWFTKATSLAYAAKSAAVRKARKEAAKAKATEPGSAPALTEPNPKPEPDPFVQRTLARVRAQMARIDRMMAEEMDPARLDRLAASFGRLAEVEQRLAGRPGPGSLRPTAQPKASRIQSLLGPDTE